MRTTRMHILLGSGGFRTEERIRNLRCHLLAHLGNIDKILFIPYALQDHDKYLKIMIERGLHADYDFVGIHRCPDPPPRSRKPKRSTSAAAIRFACCMLSTKTICSTSSARVRAGIPYVGISAGTNVACPTMKTTNDMPIVLPPSFDALGLVPFQINAHYYTGANWVKHGEQLIEHFGETRDDRLREFHEMNDTPVVGLWEAGVLICDGKTVQLHDVPARIFRKGREALDVPQGTELTQFISS